MSKNHPKLGEIWHRVEGGYIDGSGMYVRMELYWTQWRAVKVTPCGAWFQCVDWPCEKQRFALAHGARWLRRTKADALSGLIARKRRQLSILKHQLNAAQATLDLALAAIGSEKQ